MTSKTPDLTSLSESLASAVSAASPSLLRIEGGRRHGATGIAWSTDGHVLTASHAVEAEEALQVTLSDGRTLEAKLVGRDPALDLALLKVDAPLTPLAHAPDAQVGQLVLALGRPGRTVRATLGIVSAQGEGWRTHAGGKVERYLETDADRPPGFSGGALVDTGGRLLGMTSAALARHANVVLPVETLARVAEGLQRHGGVRRGYLGVGAYPVRLPPSVAKELGRGGGLILHSVEPGGPADRAGLVQGDVLVSLDEQPLQDLPDLLGFLGGEERVGAGVKARVLRAGEAREVALSVGQRP
ncbi:PDZ domain-containing protein [Aggregicoccus sp. 17bor-14]|uniref:S1C family serine protease n=1 Tax=Myxococcaceae TaxID=31 RepID=UPI00129CC1E3|nr:MULTISPECIES: trypsin-like peptidase domain-containing protein [Myxococcaceae]MBF5046244.1 trypsin-like peptidase domain-containing protein [Simulacricoccus sp. 17bor-14]MRI91967.1 PDZ domain-containing protein [Aggregicoccus sp. 17bor-14]